MRKRGNVVVIAPDEDADFVWTGSGAQPLSLWLPGSIKLGFDPKAETGMGYLTRLHTSEAAFHAGLGAACAARSTQRRRDHPAPRRSAPRHARHPTVGEVPRRAEGPDEAHARRASVAPKTTYEDRNLSEVLVLDPGATLKVGFDGAPIKMVDVILEPLYPDSFSPHVTMRFPDGTEIQPEVVQLARNSIRLRFRTPDGSSRRVLVSSPRTATASSASSATSASEASIAPEPARSSSTRQPSAHPADGRARRSSTRARPSALDPSVEALAAAGRVQLSARRPDTGGPTEEAAGRERRGAVAQQPVLARSSADGTRRSGRASAR